ncbi:unnamed protein product [Mytilus coruscus]|uniref:Uncharacterized protein n=1 Tax=Mytilus coruscus TaxID=42192 RepID=A0A6J8CJG0_MYTCO|nr:unnamed protein product [Mytilus coruscus]
MSDVAIAIIVATAFHACRCQIVSTYSFPIDACNSDPHVVDANTIVYMKFEGDLRSQDCRKMSFITPKSAFFLYELCMKEMYYDSPNCQSTLYFSRHWPHSYSSAYQIRGERCDSYSSGINRIFSQCFSKVNYVSFELKTQNNSYNRYDDRKQTDIILHKLKDTFKFQIESKWDYNCDVIGGITGIIAAMCVFTGVGIYLYIYCRRRKRFTRQYCCSSFRHRNSNLLEIDAIPADLKRYLETATGIKAAVTVPLHVLQCDN